MRDGRRALPGSRILVAEDEFLVSDMVARLGYSVTGQVANLTAVRQALAAGGFDGVLLDLRLGNELTVEAADVLIERAVPFAFVTGYPEPPEPRHSAVPMLHKPFSLDQLRLMLEQLIGPAPALRAGIRRKQA